ncbi:MAG: hypothetical protein M0R03_15285 [Novosphingobium sp.]|nr:hypothetical protein [Novosphingobium sp.]
MTDRNESPSDSPLADSPPAGPAPADPRDIERIRRQRNLVMGLLLAAFVILVFAISIVKMS